MMKLTRKSFLAGLSAEYTVKPALGGLQWMEGKVPTPHGDIEVCVDGKTLTVKGVKR